MSNKTPGSSYSYYSRIDSTLKDTIQPVGQSAVESISSTGVIARSEPEILQNALRAMTLKTEKIALEQIPDTHRKARDIINATDQANHSSESVSVLRHYCVVEGRLGARDPNTMPPEMFTVIYEFVTTGTDDSEPMMGFRDIKVRMLGQDYGVLSTSGASVGGAGLQSGPASIVGAFGKQGGEVPASDYGPSKAAQNSVTFATGIATNKSIQLYQVFRAMLKTYAGAGPHSTWISGVYITVTTDDGHRWQYMHLDPRVKVKTGDKVKKGQLLGYVARTGLMGPLASSTPHLHLQVKRGGNKKDPEPLMKSYWARSGGPPNTDWNTWINKKDEWKKTPHGWYSVFSSARAGGSHGAIDIGMKEGTAITAVVPGKVSFIAGGKSYIKAVARFKEAIQYYNQQIRRGGFVFRYKIKHSSGVVKNYAIPFAKDQIINLVGPGTDVSFDYRLGGKIVYNLPGRLTET